MRFPKFILSGPAASFQAQPFQKQPMNLGPIIQSLKTTAATPKTAPKDPAGDYEFKGTIGQVQQSQAQMDQVLAKYNAMANMFGVEAFAQMPEFKQLVQEMEYLQKPEYQNTRDINLAKLQDYDATIKEKGASADIHLGMFARTGIAMTYGDWSHYMQYAQTEEIPGKEKGSKQWFENFEYSPLILRQEDTQKALNDIMDKYGFTETGYKTGKETIMEKIDGNILGTLQEYNSSFWDKRNNGVQLGEAKTQALQRAMGGLDVTDPITGGFWQSFMQKTMGVTSVPVMADADGQLPYKEALGKRMSYDRTKEQEAELEKTHEGYYFKEGDRKGMLDTALLMQDYRSYAEFDIEQHYKKRMDTKAVSGDDHRLTWDDVESDELYKRMGDKKAATIFTDAGQQFVGSSGVTELQGFSEQQVAEMVGNTGATPETIEAMTGLGGWVADMIAGASSDIEREKYVNLVTSQENLSPLIAKDGSDGQIRYTANENFNTLEYQAAYRARLEEQHKGKGYTSDQIDGLVNEEMSRVTAIYNEVRNNQYEKGYYGETRQNMTVFHWNQGGAGEIMGWLDEAFFSDKNPEGGVKYKTGIEALSNIEVIVGDGAFEGARFVGNDEIVGFGNGVTLRGHAYAKNAGMKVLAPMVLGGVQYQTGDFMPMNVIDALPGEKVEALVKGGNVEIGNGYWDINHTTGKAIQSGAKPDRTGWGPTGHLPTMGKNGEYVMTQVSTTGPNGAQDAPGQIYSTMQVNTKNAAGKIKEWYNSGHTIKAERPSYATTKEGQEYFKKASDIITKETGAYAGSYALDVEHVATNVLKLTGKNREDYIAEARSRFGVSDAKNIPARHLFDAGGKYLAIEEKRSARNWNTTPTLMEVPMVEKTSGMMGFSYELIPEAKAAIGWTPNKTGATYYVPANVTQTLIANNNNKELIPAVMQKYADAVNKNNNLNQTRTQGSTTTGTGERGSAGSTQGTLPQLPGVKPIK